MTSRTTSEVAGAIIAGDHDEGLDTIDRAIKQRKQMMFRPGSRVRLVNTRNVSLDGQIGIVKRVNPKRIAVDIEGIGGYNVPASMLEIVE